MEEAILVSPQEQTHIHKNMTIEVTLHPMIMMHQSMSKDHPTKNSLISENLLKNM